jgi:hypothetical protein
MNPFKILSLVFVIALFYFAGILFKGNDCFLSSLKNNQPLNEKPGFNQPHTANMIDFSFDIEEDEVNNVIKKPIVQLLLLFCISLSFLNSTLFDLPLCQIPFKQRLKRPYFLLLQNLRL